MYFNVTDSHHTYTKKLQHFWVGICLRDRSADGGSTSWPLRSSHLTPLALYLWGFVTDEVYVPPMPITLKILKNLIRTAIAKIDQFYCKMFITKSDIVWRVQGKKCSTYRTWIAHEEDLFELLFKAVFLRIFVWLLLSCQQTYVLAHNIYNYPVFLWHCSGQSGIPRLGVVSDIRIIFIMLVTCYIYI
jgi:hypothetical protein